MVSFLSSLHENDDTMSQPSSGQHRRLAIRQKDANVEHLSIKARATANNDAFIISIQPPLAPLQDIEHVPCAVMLVIDVSGSMNAKASLPQGVEETGLSVLDLTKHAARTIIETLNDGDRLGLVTFSNDVEVVQGLVPMTAAAKNDLLHKIDGLYPRGSTNLWGGLREGLKQFEEQGYVPKLQPMLQKAKAEGAPPILINTFGFGYNIRSGLLQSLAEISGGTYSFIPDCGMIGTVIVHTVANLHSTFAVDATLKIDLSISCELIVSGGYTAVESSNFPQGQDSRQLVIPLGTLQFGQPRDIMLEPKAALYPDFTMSLTLNYFINGRLATGRLPAVDVPYLLVDPMSPSDSQYHMMRAVLCDFLNDMFPHRRDGERRAYSDGELQSLQERLKRLFNDILPIDALNQSIMDDVAGEEPAGQVFLALSSKEYFHRWGKHYLLSLFNAHQKQYCNSFKDPGPLQYGTQSPLFIRCRDRLNDMFDNLPPPKPSLPEGPTGGGYAPVPVVPPPMSAGHVMPSTSSFYKRTTPMKSYNSSSNPCFAPTCHVTMADKTTKELQELRPQMSVWTPKGPRSIAVVVQTQCEGPEMCVLGDLEITPWHPIQVNNKWMLHCDLSKVSTSSCRAVYSVLLQRDGCPEAHAIKVGGMVCVTLGHGLTQATGHDARGHPFLGDYDWISESLEWLKKDKRGVLQCGGMLKDDITGLSCRFLPSRG